MKLFISTLLYSTIVFLFFTSYCTFASENSENLAALYWTSNGFDNRDLTISPNGNYLLTSLVSPKYKRRFILMSKKTDGRWQPLKLAPFSGTYNDFEPMFSGDGSQLWFSSDRPRYSGDQRKDWDLWYMNVTYNSDSLSFTKPVNPGSPVNTEEDEYYPSVAANGNLYFTATRKAGPGKEDIYVAQRNGDMYQTVVPLGKGVNSTTYEFNAYVAPDESYLIFSSFQRADDLGRGDLYISFRNTKGIYEEAISLGDKINSSALDYCPFVFEGRLYFSSDRYFDPGNYERTSELEQWLTSPGNGLGDIYSIPFHPEKQLSAK